MKSRLSLYFSIETSTFSFLFYWNLDFLLTFLLKSRLPLDFPIEISTFSLLCYWNLYFLFTFRLKSLLSLYLPYWKFYFLYTFLLNPLLSLYFSIETSTFSLLFHWYLYCFFTFLLKPLVSLYWSLPCMKLRTTCAPAPHLYQPYIAKSNHTSLPPMKLQTQKFQRKAMPSVPRSPAPRPRRNCAERTPHTASHTTSFRDPVQSDWLAKHRDSHRSLRSELKHCTTPATQTASSWLSTPHDRAIQLAELPLDRAIPVWATSWWLYLLTALFNGELPLGDSTSWLRYSVLKYLLITLQLDWAIIQSWATSWCLYFLTKLSNCS